MDDCDYYSLGLDESTYVTGVCLLMIFVRTIDKNFEIKEEFLKLQPVTAGTKGSDKKFFCFFKQILGQEFQRELQDMGFIRSLVFLADLTCHLNVLNLKL
jgi:hypothetical protein